MRLFCGSLIHAGEVLVKVHHFICGSALKDDFSHITLATVTYDAVSAEDWLSLSIHVTGMHGSPTEDILCYVW